MKLEILGTGCTKCKKLYAEAEKAIAAAGVAAQLEKVEAIEDIARYGVLLTPALVIDGEVVASGRIASAEEISSWIGEAVASDRALEQ
jgi:small redox-active disulfide protein 2